MMGRQSEIFLAEQGDAWFERNKDKPHDNDPVLKAMEELQLKPERVLEVGCSDGWRLKRLQDKYGCLTEGIEPSQKAIENAVIDKSNIWNHDATGVKDFPRRYVDTIIFGFCLYLVDREDLFSIVYDSDRILMDGGHLIIYDFLPPYGKPCKVPYKHKEGVFSYKQDYRNLWLAHPWYTSAYSNVLMAEDYVVDVLVKNTGAAYPLMAMS